MGWLFIDIYRRNFSFADVKTEKKMIFFKAKINILIYVLIFIILLFFVACNTNIFILVDFEVFL